MTRREFIDELRSALSGEVSQLALNENINYYEQYFNEQESKGREIEEVLEELGNPRLIARTIIDTSAGTNDEETIFYQKVDDEEDSLHMNLNGKEYHKSIRQAKVAIWMVIIIVLLVIIGVVAIVANVIGFFAPILVPLLLIALAIRLFTKNR